MAHLRAALFYSTPLKSYQLFFLIDFTSHCERGGACRRGGAWSRALTEPPEVALWSGGGGEILRRLQFHITYRFEQIVGSILGDCLFISRLGCDADVQVTVRLG